MNEAIKIEIYENQLLIRKYTVKQIKIVNAISQVTGLMVCERVDGTIELTGDKGLLFEFLYKLSISNEIEVE